MTGQGGKRALFPSNEERLASEQWLSNELLRARSEVAAGSVTPTLDFESFSNELAKFDFEAPCPLFEVLRWTNAQLTHGIVHVTHPKYFGLFNPNPSFPAECADRIAAAFNPQLASSKTSPIAVEIESHVIRLLAGRAGLPKDATGHFTSGGTEANFTSLVCALTKADPRFAAGGVRVFDGPLRFYVSRESHLAWIKIAQEAGIGRQAVRLIATDGSGRMHPAALREAIEADRANGCVPLMVVATAGTTGAGMIDPLEECAAIARDEGLWYHIDAAWGGALIVCDGWREILPGLDLADSITVDAHKWLATTMGCGMFLTRHATVLAETFDVSTTYMPSYIPTRDPYLTTAQWSRRFVGLRLFLSLAAAGWRGYANHVEHAIELAAFGSHLLREKGWTIINNSPLAVLCIVPPRKDISPDAIVGKILASGRVWVSVASYEGAKVIRACITNGETEREDVTELALALDDALAAAAAEASRMAPNGVLSV